MSETVWSARSPGMSPHHPQPSYASVIQKRSVQGAGANLMNSAATVKAEIAQKPSISSSVVLPLIVNHSKTNASTQNTPSSANNSVQGLENAVKVIQMSGNTTSTIVQGIKMPKTSSNSIAKADSTSEDEKATTTQLSTSPTKPPSLDGKSVTSGTTFAMDEKESLRPDDSASLKAVDDEDAFSISGSITASSRVGSETGGRAFRAQFNEISERMGPQGAAAARVPIVLQSSVVPGTPEIRASPPAQPAITPPTIPLGFTRQDPDEKLLEALETPKDRLFLLRLEQDLIEFVKDSTEASIDFPQQNSFNRLLIHKLADYYFLTHFVDPQMQVRVYRTPFCRLPPPLTGISNPPTSGNTPPPNAPSMKIMQRVMAKKGVVNPDNGSTSTSNSDGPSKTTSDAGFDEAGECLKDGVQSRTDSAAGKDKASLTREEREAKYKEARERIFKGFEEKADSTAEGATVEGKESSRSSSATGNRKGGKWQKKPKDDSFEARSQFVPAFYPNTTFQPPPESGNVSYGPYQTQPEQLGYQHMVQSSIGNTMSFPAYADPVYDMDGQAVYQHTAQNYQTHHISNPGGIGPNQISSIAYCPQPLPQNMGYQNGNQMPNFYPPPMSMPEMPTPNRMASPNHSRPHSQHSSQQWDYSAYPNQYQGQFTPYGSSQSPNRVMENYIQYPKNGSQGYFAHGQPPSANFSSQRHQHPLPGSFNRNVFNPQSQSFIPNAGYPQSHSYSGGNFPYRPNSRSPMGPQYMGSPQTGHGMIRGNSSTSSSPGYNPPRQPQVHTTNKFNQNGLPQPSFTPAMATQQPHPPPTGQASILSWPTPASLPPKPTFTGQPGGPSAGTDHNSTGLVQNNITKSAATKTPPRSKEKKTGPETKVGDQPNG